MIADAIKNRFGLHKACAYVELYGEQYIPPGINSLYRPGPYGQLVMTNKGVHYKNILMDQCAIYMKKPVPAFCPPYHFVYVVCNPRYTVLSYQHALKKVIKNGTQLPEDFLDKSLLSKRDADSPVKLVMDVFFQVLGEDDSMAMSVTGVKQSRGQGLGIYVVEIDADELSVLADVTPGEATLWKAILRNGPSASAK